MGAMMAVSSKMGMPFSAGGGGFSEFSRGRSRLQGEGSSRARGALVSIVGHLGLPQPLHSVRGYSEESRAFGRSACERWPREVYCCLFKGANNNQRILILEQKTERAVACCHPKELFLRRPN
jgi:hypothetical protein